MNLYLKNQIIQIPDSDVLYYTAEGIVVTRTSKLKNNKFDKIIPDNLNSFKEVMVRGISYFYNLKKEDIKKEDIKKEDIKKMESEFKSNKIKIRVGNQWFEYPDNQIKSWDSEGNIEWSDKIHWKFLRGRPTKGDEFIYDEKKFLKIKNNVINSYIYTILDSIDIKDYLFDKKVIVVGPAPNLIDKSNGSYIDSFDIVVRLNGSYKIEKIYDYGSRTDILYVNSHFQRIHKNLNSIKYIFNINYIIKKDKEMRHTIYLKSIKVDYFSFLKNANMGILAICDLLSYDIKSLNVTGFTFYNKDINFYIEDHIEYSLEGGTDINTSHYQSPNKEILIQILKIDKRLSIEEDSIKYLF